MKNGAERFSNFLQFQKKFLNGKVKLGDRNLLVIAKLFNNARLLTIFKIKLANWSRDRASGGF